MGFRHRAVHEIATWGEDQPTNIFERLIFLQAFEAVIPSERTRIALKISEGSIRAFAPNHPGSVLVYVGDLDFSTDVVGGSPDSSFCLLVSALSLLAIDDLSDYASEVGTTILPTGIAFWKVRPMVR